MIGFSSEKIMRDKRMQISIALHRNGLSGSKYGNEILLKMIPQPKRADTISQLKLS
jgi:hypothetical protein